MKFQDLKNGRFYNEDCFEAMNEIPDGVIDMIITSPPYDELRDYNKTLVWNFTIFCEIAKKLTRILKNGGVIVWIVNDETKNGSESGTSFKQALFFKEECKLNLHDTMIWNKMEFTATGSLAVRYAPVFEYMFIFVKEKLKTFNPIKDRLNKSFGKVKYGTIRQRDGSTLPVSSIGKPINEFGQRHNIWEMNGVKGKQSTVFHPAVFPEKLIEDHVLSWSNENDCILDPFGGSGTTAIAAINTNRKWVCIEKDADYYAKAIERITNHDPIS